MKNLLDIVYKAVDSKLGEDIVVIDLTSVNPYIDYFVICSANNQRKAQSIVDEVLDKCDENNIPHKPNTNSKDSMWYLCDVGSVICHVFVGNEREKYNLEGLWKDLPTIKM